MVHLIRPGVYRGSGDIPSGGRREGEPAPSLPTPPSPPTSKVISEEEQKIQVKKAQRQMAQRKVGVVTRVTTAPTGEVTYHGVRGERYTFPSATQVTYTGRGAPGGVPTRETSIFVEEKGKVKAFRPEAFERKYIREAETRARETFKKIPRDVKYYTGRIPEKETKILRYGELTKQQRASLLRYGEDIYDTRGISRFPISPPSDWDRYRDTLPDYAKARIEQYKAIGEAELETGAAKRFARRLGSPFLGVGKILYMPNWMKGLEPKIKIGQEKIFRTERGLLYDPDVQLVGMGLSIAGALAFAPPVTGAVVGIGAAGYTGYQAFIGKRTPESLADFLLTAPAGWIGAKRLTARFAKPKITAEMGAKTYTAQREYGQVSKLKGAYEITIGDKKYVVRVPKAIEYGRDITKDIQYTKGLYEFYAKDYRGIQTTTGFTYKKGERIFGVDAYKIFMGDVLKKGAKIDVLFGRARTITEPYVWDDLMRYQTISHAELLGKRGVRLYGFTPSDILTRQYPRGKLLIKLEDIRFDYFKKAAGKPSVEAGFIKEVFKTNKLIVSETRLSSIYGKQAKSFVNRMRKMQEQPFKFVAPKERVEPKISKAFGKMFASKKGGILGGETILKQEAITGLTETKMVSKIRAGAKQFAKQIYMKELKQFPLISITGRKVLQREALRQRVSPFQTTRTDQMMRGLFGTKMDYMQIAKGRQISRTKLGLMPLTELGQRYISRTKLGLRQAQAQRQALVSMLGFAAPSTLRIRVPPPEILRTPPPPPTFFLFPGGVPRKLKKKKKIPMRRLKYMPSLVPAAKGIFGKEPKFLTGLKIRPIVRF